MANDNYSIEVWFDADGFRAELLRRFAMTSGTSANIERIGIELINEGNFVRIGPEPDILDAEFIDG